MPPSHQADPRQQHLSRSALLLLQASPSSSSSASAAYLLSERRELLTIASSSDLTTSSNLSKGTSANVSSSGGKRKHGFALPQCGACGTLIVPGKTSRKVVKVASGADGSWTGKRQKSKGARGQDRKTSTGGTSSGKQPRKELLEECLACYRVTRHALPPKPAFRSAAPTTSTINKATMTATSTTTRVNLAQRPGLAELQAEAQPIARKRRKGKGTTALLDKLRLEEQERERKRAEEGMDLMDFLIS